jgi:hypothetical protein
MTTYLGIGHTSCIRSSCRINPEHTASGQRSLKSGQSSLPSARVRVCVCVHFCVCALFSVDFQYMLKNHGVPVMSHDLGLCTLAYAGWPTMRCLLQTHHQVQLQNFHRLLHYSNCLRSARLNSQPWISYHPTLLRSYKFRDAPARASFSHVAFVGH